MATKNPQPVFSRNLAELQSEPIAPLPAAVEAIIERNMGFVPNDTREMNAVPGLIAGLMGMFQGVAGEKLSLFAALKIGIGIWLGSGKSKLAPGYKQMAAYACSLAAGCRYCQAHTAHGMERLGMSEQQIEDIMQYETSPHFSDAERAVIDLALAAGSHPNAATPQHFNRLAEHFDRQQIIELVAYLALFGFLNRWNDTVATQLEEAPAEVAQKHLAGNGWDGSRHGA